MKDFCFLFHHGFGLDARSFDSLRPFFEEENCIFWEEGVDPSPAVQGKIRTMPCVGIGHSLGLIKLLQLQEERGIFFHALIGLGGFVNFLGSDQALRKKRERELIVFAQSFAHDPASTVLAFQERCGFREIFLPRHMEKERLQQDLALLAQTFALPKATPLLIMAAQGDTVVPPAIIKDNFARQAGVRIVFLQGGHAFFHHDPLQTHVLIRDFLHNVV